MESELITMRNATDNEPSGRATTMATSHGNGQSFNDVEHEGAHSYVIILLSVSSNQFENVARHLSDSGPGQFSRRYAAEHVLFYWYWC